MKNHVLIDLTNGYFGIDKKLANKLKKGDRLSIESLSRLKDRGIFVDGLKELEEFEIEIDYKSYHLPADDDFNPMKFAKKRYSIFAHLINE